MSLRWLTVLLAAIMPVSVAAEEAEPIVISGIVHGMGGGSGSLQKDGRWTGSFSLVAWRENGGPVQTERLRVEIPDQQRDDLHRWGDRIPAKQLTSFTLARWDTNPFDVRVAILDKLVPPQADPELVAAGEAILHPPPFTDEQFGTFAPDDLFPDSLEQKYEWLGQPVTLRLEPGEGTPEQCIETLHHVTAQKELWDARMREAIADYFYQLWVDEWRADGPMMTRDEFKAVLVPSEPSMYPDGEFGFYYTEADGLDMFGGHAFAVSVSLEEGVTDVSFVG